jgi:hypothetical protein
LKPKNKQKNTIRAPQWCLEYTAKISLEYTAIILEKLEKDISFVLGTYLGKHEEYLSQTSFPD